MASGYDLLLCGARVVDPQNKVDSRLDIGIAGRSVAEVGPDLDRSRARQVIDLDGYVAIPGVVDPHTHIRGPAQRMMAMAGVCTAMEMISMREAIQDMRSNGCGLNIAGLEDIDAYPHSNPAEIRSSIASMMETGALGTKILSGVRPLTPETIAGTIQAANDAKAYVAIHCGSTTTASALDGLLEAIELAGQNSLHIAHVNSYLRGMRKDVLEEIQEGLGALEGRTNIVSESYLAIINGNFGNIGPDGLCESHVTRNCLKMRGYSPDAKGLEAAIMDGYCLIHTSEGGITVSYVGQKGVDAWKAVNTHASLSFPVNSTTSTFVCATRKNKRGRFIVDAICTDGGSVPRNVAVEYGLSLVRYQGLTLHEFVTKVSTAGAAMLGLRNKGRLGIGADADVTVLDLRRGIAVMTIVGGRLVMSYGIVHGTGGTVITTPRGEAAVKAMGVPYILTGTEDMLLYTKRLEREVG